MAASVMTKVFLPLRLTYEHAGKERTGLGDKEPAGLDEQAAFKAGKALKNGGGVFGHFGCCIEGATVIIDAESSACVDCFENDAITAELADQFGDAFDCLAEGLGRADLRANVNADAKGLQPFVAGDALVEGAGAADVDAELVLAEAGGDVGMGIGKYVGVYAQGEARGR